jgi:hypothetical protein
VFGGEVPWWAQRRTADPDGAAGPVPALEKMVAAIRKRCPQARVLVRGDSGFCRQDILAWCQSQRAVYYCVGLAKNAVRLERLQPTLAEARARRGLTGGPSTRVFPQFEYQTGQSWSRGRRVLGKADGRAGGDTPRFAVTNLPAAGFAAEATVARFEPARLDEIGYGPRAEMENVRKQQGLDWEAERLRTHDLARHQLRLWLATWAYLLRERMRALGGAGGELRAVRAGAGLVVSGHRLTTTWRPRHFQKFTPGEHCHPNSWHIAATVLDPA